MISDVLSLIEYLQKHYDKYKIVSAFFDWDAKKIEGSDLVEVIKIPSSNNGQWFYTVKEVDGYVFVFMPVIPSVHIDFGTATGEINPESKFFRFVGNPFSSVISGGNNNVKVKFIVVGYKPKDLLKISEENSHL